MNDMALALAIHVIAVVLWIGGVSFVTTIMMPTIRRTHSPQERLSAFLKFESPFAWQARVASGSATARELHHGTGHDRGHCLRSVPAMTAIRPQHAF